MANFESVRKAFAQAKPIGADYVDAIFHPYNPCVLNQTPFMSRYTGTLYLSAAGVYGFVTNSCDCSFVVLDGKLVASAPGLHGPSMETTPQQRFDVRLSAGPHPLEYYHATTGTKAVMALGWEINPAEKQPKKLQVVPNEVYHTQGVAHLPTESLATLTAQPSPDFRVEMDSSVPLPDNPVQLVAAKFEDTSAAAHGARASYEWDFGDGQTAADHEPLHVYLHPGIYQVKLTVTRGAHSHEITNWVQIGLPLNPRVDNLPTLDDYLRVLVHYSAHARCRGRPPTGRGPGQQGDCARGPAGRRGPEKGPRRQARGRGRRRLGASPHGLQATGHRAAPRPRGSTAWPWSAWARGCSSRNRRPPATRTSSSWRRSWARWPGTAWASRRRPSISGRRRPSGSRPRS